MMSFGNWLWPSRRRQLFSAASASLKIMASAVLFERHPLERTVRWRMVANELSITLLVRRCFQCSDAVGPEVDVALGGEIAPAPAQVLVRPGVLEPSDGRGREPAGVLAEQCDERFLEVAGRDAFEIENRDQHFEALRSARVGWQDRRRK